MKTLSICIVILVLMPVVIVFTSQAIDDSLYRAINVTTILGLSMLYVFKLIKDEFKNS